MPVNPVLQSGGRRVLVLLGVVCLVLTSSATSLAQIEPQSSTAGPTLRARGGRVLLLASVEPELESRLQGYLSGRTWTVVRAVSPSHANESASAPRTAAVLELAEQLQADVVVWWDMRRATGRRLVVLDARRHEVLTRDLPTGEEPGARSVVFETAALIVASALERMQQDATLGEGVKILSDSKSGSKSEPRGGSDGATPAPGQSAVVAPTGDRHDSESDLWFLSLGYHAFSDATRVRHGPRLAVGWGQTWFVEGSGDLMLPASIQARVNSPVGNEELGELTLSLWEAGLGVRVGFAAVVADVLLEPSLAVRGQVAVRRTRSRLEGVVAASDGWDAVVSLEGQVGVWAPRACLSNGCDASMRVGLYGLVGVLVRKPLWQVQSVADSQAPGAAGQTPSSQGREAQVLEAQWNRVQPGLGLGLRFGFK